MKLLFSTVVVITRCVNGTELVARMQANIQSGGVAKNRMFLFRRFNVQSDVAESCKTNCGKAFDCFKNKYFAREIDVSLIAANRPICLIILDALRPSKKMQSYSHA